MCVLIRRFQIVFFILNCLRDGKRQHRHLAVNGSTMKRRRLPAWMMPVPKYEGNVFRTTPSLVLERVIETVLKQVDTPGQPIFAYTLSMVNREFTMLINHCKLQAYWKLCNVCCERPLGEASTIDACDSCGAWACSVCNETYRGRVACAQSLHDIAESWILCRNCAAEEEKCMPQCNLCGATLCPRCESCVKGGCMVCAECC